MDARIIPDIPNIRAHWERRADPVPYLMVPMSDGTVLRFNAEIAQPAFLLAMESVRRIVYTLRGDEIAARN